MTTTFKEIKKCINCGTKNEVNIIGSTSVFGASDFDLRPAPLKRGTLMFEIQRCKKCNYASYDLEKKEIFDKSILKSEDYLNILNNPNYPELAKSFMLASLIKEKEKDYQRAANNLLKACWVLDDCDIDAKEKRIKAAELFLKQEDINDTYLILISDLYRRASLFEKALELINKAIKKDLASPLDEVALKEKKLIEKHDDLCHRIDEKI